VGLSPVPSADVLSFTPPVVYITDDQLVQFSTVTGSALDLDIMWIHGGGLPFGVFATSSGTAITIEGVRPTDNVPPIYGTFYLYAENNGYLAILTINVNLTSTYVPTFHTVTFDAGAGAFRTATPPALEVRYLHEAWNLPRMPEMYAPHGYRFRGWEDENGNILRDGFTVQRDIALTARWSRPPVEPEDFRIGELNGDGRITSADSIALARAIIGDQTVCLYHADINGDGHVDIADVTLLLRWLVGHNVLYLISH
jgi:hypothetical protein